MTVSRGVGFGLSGCACIANARARSSHIGVAGALVQFQERVTVAAGAVTEVRAFRERPRAPRRFAAGRAAGRRARRREIARGQMMKPGAPWQNCISIRGRGFAGVSRRGAPVREAVLRDVARAPHRVGDAALPLVPLRRVEQMAAADQRRCGADEAVHRVDDTCGARRTGPASSSGTRARATRSAATTSFRAERRNSSAQRDSPVRSCMNDAASIVPGAPHISSLVGFETLRSISAASRSAISDRRSVRVHQHQDAELAHHVSGRFVVHRQPRARRGCARSAPARCGA